MDINQCFLLGRIVKTHALKGELILLFDTDNPQNYRQIESVWLEVNDQLVSFPVTHINIQNQSAILKLDGVDSIDKASEFVNANIWLPLEVLPKLEGKRFYFHEVAGFKAVDRTHGELGVIEKIFDLPQQPLAQVRQGEKELLFPLKDIFIEKIDRENKTLFVNLPDGLVEIYFS